MIRLLRKHAWIAFYDTHLRIRSVTSNNVGMIPTGTLRLWMAPIHVEA